MELYNKQVMKNFFSPKNMGEIKNADGIGKVGNPQCGDIMHVYIKVEKKKNKDYIKNIKFKTMGCQAAIATSSMVTQLAKGKSIEQAEKITYKDVYSSLGTLPPLKKHCTNLAEEALQAAITDYKNKKKNSKL